jgi:5-methylcytosine-specific restriction endonuclease McrA
MNIGLAVRLIKNFHIEVLLAELAPLLLEETGRYPQLIKAPTDETINYRRGLYQLRRRGLLEQVIARDGLWCKTCGKAFKSRYDEELTIDHKISIGQGGKPIAIVNLQLLCVNCHKEKQEIRILPRD